MSAEARERRVRPAGSLRWKYSWAMAGLLLLAAILFGGTEIVFGLRQSIQQSEVARLRSAESLAASVRTQLQSIERQLTATAMLPWEESDWLNEVQMREEFRRLIRVLPLIRQIELRDASGETVLSASARLPDRWIELSTGKTMSGRAVPRVPSNFGIEYSEIERHDGYEPSMEIRAGINARGGFVVLATVSLRSLMSALGEAMATPGLDSFVVDRQGQVILHRDTAAMLSAMRLDSRWVTDQAREGRSGTAVLAAKAPIHGTTWWAVSEQPAADVRAGALGTLWRTLIVTFAAVVAAVLAAGWLASRAIRPIRQLQSGAQQIAAGDLATRLDIRTNDELEDLAAQFNRMAERLQESVETLEQKVTERTAALLAASQHKDNFLAEMSHELRTPLNSILGFADVLREGMAGPLNDEQHEYLGDIHTSGRHLLSLIEDLLDIAKIPAGKLVLSLVPVDVGQPVQGAIASTRGECLRKNVQLTVGRAGTAPATIVADERRVRQILINLIGNAIKFTPEGGHVAVRIAGSARYPGGLRLEVEDHGIGIAAGDLERIWEPFVQGVQSPHSATKGAGLGLALVRLLTELHGGTASVSSVPGQGATFAVDLPAEAPPQVTIQTEGTRT